MYNKLLKSDNYIKFLEENTNLSRLKTIQIGYELQAGSYEANYSFSDLMKKRVEILKEEINKVLENKDVCNIIEIGIGEGNTLRHLIENLNEGTLNKVKFYGIELSLSRTKISKKHLPMCNLVVGDMNNLPFSDNSFDIVYTASAIEPNINNEELILKEIYRICKHNIILFEISYKEATIEVKKRFDEHRYVKYLYETIKNLNYNLIEYKELQTTKTYNNYLYFIKKSDINSDKLEVRYISPIFNDNLDLVTYDNSKYYKSKNLNLYFPIIDNIPIFLIENSIIISNN